MGLNRKKDEFSTGEITVTVKWILERQRILLDTYVSLGLQNTTLYVALKAGAEAAPFELSGARSDRQRGVIPSEINSTASN